MQHQPSIPVYFLSLLILLVVEQIAKIDCGMAWTGSCGCFQICNEHRVAGTDDSYILKCRNISESIDDQKACGKKCINLCKDECSSDSTSNMSPELANITCPPKEACHKVEEEDNMSENIIIISVAVVLIIVGVSVGIGLCVLFYRQRTPGNEPVPGPPPPPVVHSKTITSTMASPAPSTQTLDSKKSGHSISQHSGSFKPKPLQRATGGSRGQFRVKRK